jgi:hypothetical protein
MNISGTPENFTDSPCLFRLVVKALAIAEEKRHLVLTETHIRSHGLDIELSRGILALKFGHHRRDDTRCGITIVLDAPSVCH